MRVTIPSRVNSQVTFILVDRKYFNIVFHWFFLRLIASQAAHYTDQGLRECAALPPLACLLQR